MKNNSFSIGRILMWVLLGIILFLTLFPFWWVLRTALTTQTQIFDNPTSLLPVGFTWFNFERVLGLVSTTENMAAGGSGQSINFAQFLWNSIRFATIITVGQVFFSTMAAYSFARLRFPGRDLLFNIYIAALMVPGIVLLIPNFVLITDMGRACPDFTAEGTAFSFLSGICEYIGTGTMSGLVAPYFLMTPFAVFFLRQFFLGINRELEEAATIDGAGYFRTFWSIILPLSRHRSLRLALSPSLPHGMNIFGLQLLGAKKMCASLR